MSDQLSVTEYAFPAASSIEERIGYRFRNKQLLHQAITHSSALSKQQDYQRLEFLGDRVLGLVIADELFRLYPDLKEGAMANLHSHLVRGEACAEVGRQLALEAVIEMGQTEQRKGVSGGVAVLGDVVEALIGGIYLDSGLEIVRKFILANWAKALAERREVSKDSKTYLQEWALSQSLPIPHYVMIKREGLDHSPIFTIELQVKGKNAVTGQGHSKRQAEMEAAKQFLQREGLRS